MDGRNGLVKLKALNFQMELIERESWKQILLQELLQTLAYGWPTAVY